MTRVASDIGDCYKKKKLHFRIFIGEDIYIKTCLEAFL